MAYDDGIPGLRLADHWVTAPLDHANPTGETIEVYAREVVGAEHARPHELPWLVFLQGGPGGASPRPVRREGWIDAAVERYRVLLLDQRGTGRSTPLTPARVTAMGSDEAVAAYAGHHRADAIVRDAELFRERLADGARWSTIGQSYGGFCTFVYLSLAPEGLERCLVTGGVPPIGLTAEEVYRRTWPRIVAKNREHHARWPGDRDRLREVAAVVREGRSVLPTGDPMTVDRLQALGIAFGMSTGSAEIHHLLGDAIAGGQLTPGFLAAVAERTAMVTQPLFALIHEPIYSEGPATAWAAERVRADVPEAARDAEDVLLIGEIIEPWRFVQESAMHPYAAAAEILAARADWGSLYDRERLSDNEVPVCAAVYYDDMYVDAHASLDVVGRAGRARAWVTNQYEHDGLRADAEVFRRLDRMSRGLA
ncbi:Proline iminopeptidase [Nostocoides japonicum T1-X7]|uniref:Proline iminopeptidase n=1 Tax=Nostocoides japonicum T1-X7 TaxID=1194083 RepID=A0A077LXF4_9MICO|nr:alpha/beta fold hydrolase [Tetrasphaera japonica]CCH77572.1 Proline iminopeptidase [Tetrasphaera japonica T1-X7]